MSDKKRQKDVNPYKHIHQKTNDDWFLYWLCEDPEFNCDMAAYIEFFESRTDKNDIRKINITEEEAKVASHMRDDMIKKYGISEDEFDFIQTGMHWQTALDFPFEIIERHEDDSVTVRIPSNIKRSDYIAAWDDLEDYLHPSTYPPTPRPKLNRRRAADDTQLIYATYKARREGLTFGQIYEKYQKGILDSYQGKVTNQFSSEDSLERYYDKYKPDR